jgi:SM-20-related protein
LEFRLKGNAVTKLDLERFEQTPLTHEPFEHLVVQEFVKAEERRAINDDYPKVETAGSFPLSEVTFGPKFKEIVDDLNSPEFRAVVERKFSLTLTNRPTMITVRGRCSEKDGKIHTDSKTKIITVLLYLNAGWEETGGRLRLLRSEDIEDVLLEVPPVDGTLLAFKRSDNSWHGHKPFSGERRVVQFNWVTSEEVVRREQNRHRFSATIKKIFGPFAARRRWGKKLLYRSAASVC